MGIAAVQLSSNSRNGQDFWTTLTNQNNYMKMAAQKMLQNIVNDRAWIPDRHLNLMEEIQNEERYIIYGYFEVFGILTLGLLVGAVCHALKNRKIVDHSSIPLTQNANTVIR